MEDIHALCAVDIEMGTKRQCAILSLLTGNELGYESFHREGELRMCKKVGENKEEVIVDTRADKQQKDAGEWVMEPEKPINNSDENAIHLNADSIPEVKLSEEGKRKIVFSDQIEFK